jgi:SAM-dependent methyltransferase
MKAVTQYYNETASEYDALHGDNEPEHIRALELGWPLVGTVQSVLDVGCGTGRGLSWLARTDPALILYGIEPSDGMIAVAAKQLPLADIRKGSGEHLPFEDLSIDVATATGIMHHVDDPSKTISEMFRVARKAVLISDHNNYAFGGDLMRRLRMGLWLVGLLKPITYVRQGFNHRGYSEEDGWWYPYSLLDNYSEIANRSSKVFIFPTRRTSSDGNLIFCQSHFAIVAIK